MQKVLTFSAEWCIPCQKFAPVVEEMKKEYAELEFSKFDVDRDVEMAYEHQIYSIPTVVFVENDVEIGRISGYHTAEQFRDKIISTFSD